MGNENRGKVGVGGAILSIVFLLWFFASIGAMIYCSKHDMGALVVTLFGQYFLVFGTIAVFSGLKSKDFQPITLLFPLVGIGCMIGGCIFQFGSEEVMKYAEAALPYLFLGLFFVIGVSLVVGSYFSSKRRHEVCNYRIMGTCVKIKTSYHKGTRTYCPVYEAYFRDETILLSNNTYSNMNHIEEGETRELYLNPDNPKEFYEPKEERSLTIFLYVLGSIFAAVSAFALAMVLFFVR
ncbi:MAG: DUF3592 domain-containing protein [Lachnospiraceae bacterium]|jgi:hypothetical protein|nr:DUF3592 domain-containing protein [Lachnospiraceae bacterium]